MHRCLIAFALLVLIPPLPLWAQTLLRWKLKAGDSLTVEISKQTQSQVDFSGKSAATKIDLMVRLNWRVTSVDEKALQISQSIDQIRATLTTPAGTAEFDSTSQARATGLVKQLAESLQPLIGAEIEVALTPLGEVQSAQPANEAAQKLFAAVDARADDSAATARGSLAQLLSQSFLQLPAKAVTAGDHWSTEGQLSSVTGPLTFEMTYALEEIVGQDDARLAKIKTSGNLPEQQSAGKNALRIQSHEQSGNVLFSIDQGRPLEIDQQQRLKTQRTYRDSKIDVSLNTHTKTTFTADGAKK